MPMDAAVIASDRYSCASIFSVAPVSVPVSFSSYPHQWGSRRRYAGVCAEIEKNRHGGRGYGTQSGTAAAPSASKPQFASQIRTFPPQLLLRTMVRHANDPFAAKRFPWRLFQD